VQSLTLADVGSGAASPVDPVLAQFAVRRERHKQRSVLLFADCEPGFDGRDAHGPSFDPPDGDELPRAALIGIALTDRDDEEAGPPEVEVLDVEANDLGAPASRRERQQARPRGRGWQAASPASSGRAEPFGGDGGPPVVAAGTGALGAFEAVAHDPVIATAYTPSLRSGLAVATARLHGRDFLG
jgi:hypothetical protein